MDWYLSVWKKYAVFSGRAQRAEYWYFVLFNCLAIIGLVIIDSITGSFDDDAGIGLLSGLYYLGVLLPSLAVTVRRLHDTGRSGWWMLIALLPFLGGLILLFFAVQDSQPGGNQYGLNPKGGELTGWRRRFHGDWLAHGSVSGPLDGGHQQRSQGG